MLTRHFDFTNTISILALNLVRTGRTSLEWWSTSSILENSLSFKNFVKSIRMSDFTKFLNQNLLWLIGILVYIWTFRFHLCEAHISPNFQSLHLALTKEILSKRLFVFHSVVNSTVWKFQDFFITQILREINFEDSRSANSAILRHLWIFVLFEADIYQIDKIHRP